MFDGPRAVSASISEFPLSLLGRLEDLSFPDIIQIVFLSRRTGVLEILDPRGRYTVLFQNGLIVSASSPGTPDLSAFLQNSPLLPPEVLAAARHAAAVGAPFGSALLASGVVTTETLAEVVRTYVLETVAPLVGSTEGEFNFILSEVVGPNEIGYDPKVVFAAGGISPQKVLGAEGEKVRPLRGLEESMRAGKALLRPRPPGGGSPDAGPVLDPFPGVDGEGPALAPEPLEEEPFDMGSEESPAVESFDSLLAADSSDPAKQVADEVPSTSRPPRAEAPPVARFRIGSGDEPIASERQEERNIVVFERDPLVRVSVKRAFTKRKAEVYQFGSAEDTRTMIGELLEARKFFVTFLEADVRSRDLDEQSLQLLLAIKRKNHHLPIVVIDREGDLTRRSNALQQGADLYITRPSEAHLRPDIAQTQLALFADELVLFAETAFSNWQRLTGEVEEGEERSARFYTIPKEERLERSFGLVRQLINELSSPDDVSQVAMTIVRLASEYLERGALFAVTPDGYLGLAGFSAMSGVDDLSSRVRKIRVLSTEDSILREVVDSRTHRRGKMRRTPANEMILSSLGGRLPTEVAVLPVVHEERVVGVLYGDNAEQRTAIEQTTGLEIFLSQASFALANAIVVGSRQTPLTGDGS